MRGKERFRKTSVETFFNHFTEEAVTTEAESLFQYFTTVIENPGWQTEHTRVLS